MNILLIILASIVALVVLILVLALFTKKGYSIQREVIINKPKEEVFFYLKHLRNQDMFSKWVMTDPFMDKKYTGVDGTVGFIYAWEGNKQAGKGEQEIKNIIEGERLDIEVRFVKPFEAIAQTPFTTEAISPNQTKVIWFMISEMKYPMNIIMLFMNMDTALGKDMDISLGNLKTILEH
jgi:hypothetical protein